MRGPATATIQLCNFGFILNVSADFDLQPLVPGHDSEREHVGAPPDRRVDEQAVTVVAAGQRDAPNDLVHTRVDHRHLVARLHVDQDPAGNRVVLHVAGLAAEPNRRDAAAARVEDRFDRAALVGDEDAPPEPICRRLKPWT